MAEFKPFRKIKRLGDLIEAVGDLPDNVLEQFAQKMYDDIKRDTPIVTGQTKNNWSIASKMQPKILEVSESNPNTKAEPNAKRHVIWNTMQHVRLRPRTRTAFLKNISRNAMEKRMKEVLKDQGL